MKKTKLSILLEDKQKEYQKLFKSLLKKYNVSSPNELSDDDKKKFFNTLDSKWKTKKEVKEELELTLKNKTSKNKQITEEELHEWINSFNKYSTFLFKEDDEFTDAILDISDIAKVASRHIVESKEDWFSKIVPKKDSKKLETYAKNLENIKENFIELKKEASAIFEDCGSLLNRYYKIKSSSSKKRN